jgi:hypothetical protein
MESQRGIAPEAWNAARAAGGLFGISAVLLVVVGWAGRDHDYVSPEFGVGYGLGVAGSLMMLALLVYSARKNLRFMRTWGRVKPWFQAHQLLGIAGPVCILFHANFRLGSANSNVALACMLLIVASGLIGRYLHGRVHGNLRAWHRQLAECRQQCLSGEGELAAAWASAASVRQRIQAFEAYALGAAPGQTRRMMRVVDLPLRARWARVLAMRDLRQGRLSLPDGRAVPADSLATFVPRYIAAVRRVAEYGVYERLFALWHLLHVPLFFMLLISSLVHIVAVHAY